MADITNASLEIQGIGLSVETTAPVTTSIGVPTTVQTSFGGKMNDAALAIEGLLAVGDLVGPGLDSALELSTAPGHRFEIPGMSKEGTYTLQNVRLMKGRELLQYATPSSATIVVADLFQTAVEVRQLTPEEIRERGIVIDARNFEVYEYTLTFLIRGETVKIPFPVIIDPRTRQVQEMPIIDPYKLPPVSTINVGRWTPPDIVPITFEDDQLPPEERNTPKEAKEPGEKLYKRPPIPAAIVIPNSIAVMHQFFAVVLTVQNGAPNGSTATLENISAMIKVPSQLRTASSKPAISLGQAVPIVDKERGITLLVAQAKGEAEWSVEALKPGTHTIEIELKATLKENGQDDVPLVARPRASVVVHDARFNIAFSHPEVVRKNIEYTTYSFVTNTSPSTQTIQLGNSVPPCETAGTGANVCRIGGGLSDEITIPSGETRTVEYRMKSGVTGKVFATAASIDSAHAVATAQLHMGVSDTGIPLSPTTLIMPHYAQYVSESLVSEYLQILGLGFSLATAPATTATAKLPRVIKGDVYRRAVDIAQAGQAIFLANDAPGSKRDATVGLALDLLGNQAELSQWDALRRLEKYARPADAAVVRELEATGLTNGTSFQTFIDNFGKAASHRAGYVAALVHGPAVANNARPYALSLRGASSGRRTDIPNEEESGWVRDLPYADLSRISSTSLPEYAELAMVGRWTAEDLEVIVTPSVDGPFTLELLFPDAADATSRRARLELTGVKDQPLRIPLARGTSTVNALLSNGGIAKSATSEIVPLETLRVVGARQDLYLDENGHKMSVLFNRPVASGVATDKLREKFHATIDFNKDGVVFNDEPRPISGAALQQSARVIDLTFDYVLTTNVTYALTIDALVDPRTTLAAPFPGEYVPKIDNDRPAGIIYGKFVRGDNTPLVNHEVILFSGVYNPETHGLLFLELENPPRRIPLNIYFQPPQITNTRADGAYLFEFVRREFESGFDGSYRLFGHADNLTKYTHVNGTVRLPGRVQFVNLQLLGRGRAEGYVRYENGEVVKKANVTVGSTVFEGVRSAQTDDQGFYRIEDLPVGPLAFTVTDGLGNIGYAAGEIATPGEIEQQDVSIYRQPTPKNGRIHGVIRRSDTNSPVAGASVGIFNNGYPLLVITTDSDGRYNAEKVPAGFISVVAAEWSISRQSATTDFDLKGDEVRQVDLTLSVRPEEQLTTVTGQVLREDPQFPGDATKYQPVAAALVKIDGMRIVTAGDDGKFEYANVPLTFGGRKIAAYDPVSKRIEEAVVPQLKVEGPNDIPILLRGLGKGTIRAKLFDAHGVEVSNSEMLVKQGGAYFVMSSKGSGVYELTNVPVGQEYIVRTGETPAAHKHQEAISIPVRVAFAGQTVSVTLRLPGKGDVRARVKGISIPSDGSEPIMTPLITEVTLRYPFFNSATQATEIEEKTLSTNNNGLAGDAVFTNIPALKDYSVVSEHPLGHSGATNRLAFDGDLGDHTLTLSNLGHIFGVVYAIDGVTPVPGATVRMQDGHQDQGTVTTGLDGKFAFRNVAPGAGFILTAESTQSGIYRIAERRGGVPGNGGVVNTSITLLERGQIEGRIVYAGYKVYDPLNPANNVADTTPNDPSDNAPVPMAKLYLRELDFPRREMGTNLQPLQADLAGRFAVGNVFIGRIRATAWSTDNPDLRGDWTATLTTEGELLTPYIAIGDGGTGRIIATVTNPNAFNGPVENAEVYLYRGGLFDVGSTQGDGTIRFEQVPVGTYFVTAYSKALGKSGRAEGNVVVTRDGEHTTRVMLTFSGQVTGRITDPQSNPPNSPIPGSHVTISMAEGFDQRFTTDNLGQYIFEGVREGSFTLEAKDVNSNRRAKATGYLSAADPAPVVNLELEPTTSLHVAVYLPNDTGGNSGILAGPVDLSVRQRNNDFNRTMQGNPLVMTDLFLNASYDITVEEIGGSRRRFDLSGSFPNGSASQPISFHYPAYGNLEVLVRLGTNGPAVPDARVTVRVSRYDIRVYYADSAGRVLAPNLPLNQDFSITATTLDGSSGSSTARVLRQSVLATTTVAVGSRAYVTGKVTAEAGGPSIGTPVVIQFAGGQLSATTDDQGSFTFAGVAVPSGITLLYYGPDGSTLGASQSFSLGVEWAGKTYTADTRKIDATPPLLIDIVPAQGANNVPPDTHLKFVFSEPIRSTSLSNDNFSLQPADGSPRVNASFSAFAGPDGTYIVTMVPPAAPAGQAYPLKSNTLYRLIVHANVQDSTGHTLGTNRGLTFTTADYIEPRVVATTPAAGYPIPQQITYEFRFNEPLDPAPFLPNGNGVFQLSRMSGPEENATVVANETGTAYIDPITGISLFFAPDSPTTPNGHYRIKFSGVRDLQGNVVPEHTYRYASFDTIDPFVRLVSPVPGDASLVTGLTYRLTPVLLNTNPDGTPNENSPATDIDYVEFYRVENGSDLFIKSVKVAPYAYEFVAPDAPTAGLTLTFKARAKDKSVRESAMATLALTVKPNQPPTVSVALDRTTNVYAGERVNAALTAADEVVEINVQLDVKATRTDNTEYRKVYPALVKRNSLSVPWPVTSFAVDLPTNLKGGTTMTFTGIATDMSGLSSNSTTPLTLSVDTTPPAIVATTPEPWTGYAYPATYKLSATVTDVGSGVSKVVFNVDDKNYEVTTPVAGTFTSPLIKAAATTVDKNKLVTVTAYDYSNNTTVHTFNITYLAVSDADVPVGEWLCPISGAALPANVTNFPLKLSLRALDNLAVTSVKFQLPGSQTMLTPTETSPGIYTMTVNIDTPTAGTGDYVITAFVDDGDEGHTQEYRVSLEFVAVDLTIDSTQAIIASDVHLYQDKSVVVRGTSGRLVPHVPVRFKNLIVLEGARVDTLPTTTSLERRLELSVTDNLYVDCDSKIDVTGLGYLGAHQPNYGSNTSNDGVTGRTSGNTTTGGSTSAGGSHGGIGVAYLGTASAAYGSYKEPRTLGSGGGGEAISGTGGGAVAIDGPAASFIIAGDIRANGNAAAQTTGAGAGGSILLKAADVVIGGSGSVTANGGDMLGGGGGRVAIYATRTLAMPDNTVQARGGRNHNGEWPEILDGGAGTIYIVRPDSTEGELRVSSFDERHPATVHGARYTPVSTTDSELVFRAITVGPHSVLRLDNPYRVTATNGVSVHNTALLVGPDVQPVVSFTTNPPADSTVWQNAPIALTFNASSTDGVGEVRVSLPGRSDQVVPYLLFPASVGPGNFNLTIPANANPGPIAIKTRVTSRSGRTFESTANYTISPDTAPTVAFDSMTPTGEIYAGGTIAVSASAADDIDVKSINLTLNPNVGTVAAQTATKPTPLTMARQFTVTLNKTAPSNTSVGLVLAASDGFPSRAATTVQQDITIRKDQIAPALAITKPVANQTFTEASNATFTIEATATDAEVGINTVIATFEGTPYPMLPVSGQPGRYSVSNVPLPSVEGSDPITRTITVTATDFEPNTTTQNITINIAPLVDPNAPIVRWACSSPNSLYTAGYTVPLRIYAAGANASNAVTRVEFTINGGAPIVATETSAGSQLYAANFPIPTGTPVGTVYQLRALAVSQSSAQSVLLSTFTVVTGNYVTSTTLGFNDFRYENATVIVSDGVILTVHGPHTFKDLVVLSGGKVVQTHTAIDNAPDKITVDRLFVACGGSVDVSSLGYTRTKSYPGSGTPVDSAGGGHMGRGGEWASPAGATYGSIFRPSEMGGAGHSIDINYVTTGGGVVRLEASQAVTVDGAVRANGIDNGTWGPGAGGSVWITTPGTLSVGGTIEARGGGDTNNRGGGGGGAIAMEYGTASGPLTDQFVARGGATNSGRPGAAGTVYLRSATSTHGDLIVDNFNYASAAVTDLPWLGTHVVGSVNGATATLDRRGYIQKFQVGNWAQVVAPDGTIRGTWRISAIENDPQAVTPGYGYYLTSDSLVYDGYLIYTPNGVTPRLNKMFAAKYENGQWQFDNDNNTFTNYTPTPNDRVFATFKKGNPHVLQIKNLKCGETCGTINGIQVAELVSGVAYGNLVGNNNSAPDVRYFGTDYSEFAFGFDGELRNVILVQTAPKITLASAPDNPVVLQPGDKIRGIHRFDSVKVKRRGAVITKSWVDTAVGPTLETNGTFSQGNIAGPSINKSKLSITKGRYGPVLTGAAGAVSDPDGKVDAFVHNPAMPVTPAFPETTDVSTMLTIPHLGGLRLLRINNGNNWGSATLTPIGDYGYLTFQNSYVGKLAHVGMAPHYFHFPAGGRWEVWPNNAWANSGYKQGSLTTATKFRIEKTPEAVRWYVDDALVYELAATNIPPSTSPVIAVRDDDGIYDFVEYYTAATGTRTIAANADGSFNLPFDAAAGSPVTVSARDRNSRSREVTGPTPAGLTVPADFGIASVTFPGVVNGGRATTGTVTLRSAAGSAGAYMHLSTPSSSITIPASVSIAAGALSANFAITTKPVDGQTFAPVNAKWGGETVTGTLELAKDVTPPALSITVPAANAQYTEGAAAGIPVEANITDLDSGIATVTATIDTSTVTLTKNTAKGPNAYTGTLPTPFIDGSSNVTKNVVVTATDNNANAGNATVSVVIKPIVDANPPTVSWSCSGPGAFYPVGYGARLRVTAKAPNGTNYLHKVEMIVTDHNGVATTYPATSLGTDLFEYILTIPDVADGTVFTTRALVTTASGTTAETTGSFTIVKGANELTANTTISASNTTYDNTTLVIRGGTTTIDGAHKFTRLIVLNGAAVTHTAGGGNAVNVEAGIIYVECGGSIDAGGRGYPQQQTYPGEVAANGSKGGTHIGRGANADVGAAFGSIYRPMEAGGGGYAGAGGGAVRLKTANLRIDGIVHSNGNAQGGGGGSVWIIADRIHGVGAIEARGSNAGGYASYSGGGGAISIEYTDATSVIPVTRVIGGDGSGCCSGIYLDGGVGSLYVKGPQSVYGDLTLANHDTRSRPAVELPGLGKGTAQAGSSGANLVTDLAANIPTYFAGHWVEIRRAGVLKGTYRIGSVSAKTATLDANGADVPSVAEGDQWQGVYRFDNFNTSTILIISTDPIRAGRQEIGANETRIDEVSANDLVVKGTLSPIFASGLVIDATNEVRVETGGIINVVGYGWPAQQTNPAAVPANASQGGSHIGRGAQAGVGSTFGSLVEPRESGGGSYGGAGGGIIRITAPSVVVNGTVRATGAPNGGAGGSLWITTQRLNGTGLIDASGADAGGYASYAGGGGVAAVEWTDATSVPPTIRSIGGNGGGCCSGIYLPGAPGAVYLKRPGSVYGDLEIVSADTVNRPAVELPSLGSGTARAGSTGATLVTDRTSIPTFWVKHWVEIYNAAGTVKGMYRIASITGGTLNLTAAAGETIDVQPGDVWYGNYRFDKLKIRNNAVTFAGDRVAYTTLDKDTSAFNNGAPRFDPALVSSIALSSDTTGHYVRGPIGVIVDENKPNTITATNKRSNAVFTAAAAPDGSFSVKVEGLDNDVFTVFAADVNQLRSRTVDVNGALGASSIASVSVSPASVGGGVSATGTVTLALPAGTSGLVVTLASSSVHAVPPPTVNVAPGALTVQFPITTTEPAATVEAIITASNQFSSRTATLTVMRDTTGPAVTITAPAANAQFTEGSANLINVKATAADDLSGIKRVYATIGGVSTDLIKDNSQPNLYSGNVPAPFIEGDANVTMDLVVTGIDGRDNSTPSAAVPVVIKPIVDPNAPTNVWSCSSDAIYPVGHTAKLRVVAKIPAPIPPATTSNYIAKVEAFITDPANVVTTVIASPVSGSPDTYEAAFIVPDVADGTVYTTRVVATSASGSTAQVLGSITVVKGGMELTGDTTIADGNPSYDNKSLIIRSGTTTIAGKHTFVRIAVLEGAKLDHVSGGTNKLDLVVTGGLYVACGGAVDVTGKGWPVNTTYPGETVAADGSGGSHIGRGGLYNHPQGSTFGSVYRPLEAGGGAGTCCGGAGIGGGVVRIEAGSIAVDGAIRANGQDQDRSAAGGSVWLTTTRITGAGSIETNGGHGRYGLGAGGAIAIEFTDPTSRLPILSSRTGTNSPSAGERRFGAAGSIYVRGPHSTYGDLTLDNQNVDANPRVDKEPVILPSLGTGTAQSGTTGSTLVTNRAKDVSPYFGGHWVEIYAPNGTLKGTWRIAPNPSGKTVTLVPNGTETIDLAVGDTWQGVYRFDNLKATGIRVESPDPIRVSGTHTIEGSVETEQINAGTLVVKGTLTHLAGRSLSIKATELRVETGGSIDVTGRGFGPNTSYSNEQIAADGTGGSHIGNGGYYNSPYGATFGSVYQPREGGGGPGTCCGGAGYGGGVVRIEAPIVLVNGSILANGQQQDRTGAGGSVWITANRISGTGRIETNGGPGRYGIGGGGAIAIEYTDQASVLPTLSSRTGTSFGERRFGAAGSIYIKHPASTYGDLTIDNENVDANPRDKRETTVLPSFGKGLALAGSTGAKLVTNRSQNIQPYHAGHWVEITGTDGAVKGTWRIAKVDAAKTVTLAPNGTESISIVAGDSWQGVYLFDNLQATNVRLESADPIRATTQTIEGNTEIAKITAVNVVVKGTLTHATGAVSIEATDVLIDATGAIDVSAKGFVPNTTYPNEQVAADGTGGSHIGRGGLYNLPFGATFGSIYRPRESGGGAGTCCGAASAGGGNVYINAPTVVVNGAIRANGGRNDRSGAGGSVWIKSGRISGTGRIETNGGDGRYGIGGGGAIAIEYTDPNSVPPLVFSRTGANYGESRYGGAGSIYYKRANSIYGDLIVDSGGVNKEASVLPSLGAGGAATGSSGAVVVTDRATNIQPYFVGHWVEVTGSNGIEKGTWRIASVEGKTMTLAPNSGEPITVQPGDTWRGVYLFDNVYLRTQSVVSGDEVISTNPIDKGTTIVDVNDGPPVFVAAKRSQIVVVSAIAGDSVTGPAGAVTDTSTPIKVTVTNSRTAANFTVNANPDGSFSIPVTGNPGDAFTIFAADSHSLPLTSARIAVNGTILESNTLTAFNIEPPTVSGGATTYGSLRLTAPARAGGATVTLTSSTPHASVPATVLVPAGSQTMQFPIVTTSPASQVNAVITATLGPGSLQATFAIAPASSGLADLTVTSSTVVGGASLTGTVILGAPAPPGGALVVLSSDSPEVVVPSTVLVNQGNLEGSFTITTSSVGAAKTANLSAMWGASDTVSLRITACTAMTTTAAAPATSPITMWFDDAAPAGAVASGDATFKAGQVASGSMALHFPEPTTAAIRAWTFTGAAALPVTASDTLVLYALVNPCKPPRQILAEWSDGTTSYRASWGENRIGNLNAVVLNAGSTPVGGEWRRLEVVAKSIGITAAKNLTSFTVSVDGGEAWIDAAGVTSCTTAKAAKPQYLANETIWFDDAIPAGAIPETTYAWDTTQVASGSFADVVGSTTETGLTQHVFNQAPGFAVNAEDMLITYVFLDPCNPPRELVLQWNDINTGWSRRAFWGENLHPGDWGALHTVERRRMGALPETGKWVRLEIPAASMSMNGMKLRGMAFTLFGGRAWFDRVGKVTRVNLALNKPAEQSTLHQTNPNWVPASAVDGNLALENFTHTDSEFQAYWQVDLGAVQPIDSVDVWNATSCCQARMSNFYVLVSDKAFISKTLSAAGESGVTSYYYNAPAGRPTSFEVGRTGRYIRVQLASTNFLHISEVQVWAPVSAAPVNVAVGRTATQSSTHNALPAALAVNGTSIGPSNPHTGNDLEAWWEVDLGSIQSISTVDLDNVFSSPYWQRLTNYYLFVSDAPFPLSATVAQTLARTDVSAYYRTGPTNSEKFEVNRTGQYVRIQLTGTNYIHPMEVRVWSPSRTIAPLAKTPDPLTASLTTTQHDSRGFDFATAYRRPRAGVTAMR